MNIKHIKCDLGLLGVVDVFFNKEPTLNDIKSVLEEKVKMCYNNSNFNFSIKSIDNKDTLFLFETPISIYSLDEEVHIV